MEKELNKYELTEGWISNHKGVRLYQIRCLRDIKHAKAGDLGGFVESEKNLSQEGDAWIADKAQVWGKAAVFDNALVSDEARVFGNAVVYDDAFVSGRAEISDWARVHGNARVTGHGVQINGYTEILGSAKIGDEAHIGDSVTVEGQARVCGTASLHSTANIGGTANIEDDSQHCGFDGFGRIKFHVHAYLTTKGDVEVTHHWWRGSLEAFEKKVEEMHAGNKYEYEYRMMIALIRLKFGLPV